MDWTRLIYHGTWLVAFLCSVSTAMGAIPCDMKLDHVGFTFYSKHLFRGDLQPLQEDLVRELQTSPTTPVVRTSLAGNILIRAVALGNTIVVYYHDPRWTRSSQKIGQVHRIIRLPSKYSIRESEISEITQLIHHPGKPFVIAVGSDSEVLLIDVVSGKIAQKFSVPDPGRVTSVILDPEKLLVGTYNHILLFRPQDQRGVFVSKKPLAYFDVTGHATHLTEAPYATSEAIKALLVAGAHNRAYIFGYNHQNNTYRRPILSFPNAVTSLHLFSQPTQNPKEEGRLLLLVRTNNPTLSAVHVYDVHTILKSEGKCVKGCIQNTPPQRHYPHVVLFSYQHVDMPDEPTESLGILVANPDFSRGFLYDITTDYILRPISPDQVARLIRAYSPFDMPLD